MARYVLINGATQAFINPVTIVPYPADGPIPQPVIADEQTFQLTATANPGQAVSANVQVLASNDDGSHKNWVNLFDPISVSGTTSVTAGFGGSQNWKYYSAILLSLTGVGAKAFLTMNG